MNQSWSKAKGNPAQMEDAMVITPHYIAVFDGATPKTAFRFPDGRTPGQVAAQCLADTTATLPPELSAQEATQRLTDALREALDGHRGEASGVIYSIYRGEIWRTGDCPFALIDRHGHLTEYRTEKRIDQILSDWRASIVRSYLDRGIMSTDALLADDPGRRIIQPFITRQVDYQNLDTDHPLAFGVFDGTPIPQRFIEVFPIGDDITRIILASDGYPRLYPTLEETEIALQQMLQDDPLCIASLRSTKGLRPGNNSFDDRTYISYDVPVRE